LFLAQGGDTIYINNPSSGTVSISWDNGCGN